MEARTLFSNIVWANRDDPANNFADTFGVFAGQAMAVVDAVIERYERVIVDFNWRDATRFDLNVSMRDQPTNPRGGQCPPDEMGIDAGGAPRSANVYFGSGLDVNGDGLGDGAGYFLDPTPDDFAEFTTIVNAFAGDAPAGSAAAGGRDFYTLVAHEIGHAVGMTSAPGSRWNSTIDLWATDTGVSDVSGGGNLWAYSSNRVARFVLTDTDLGQSSDLPVHSAVGTNNPFQWNGQTYTPAVDVMNNTSLGINGRRRLISNAQIGMMADIYGYDIAWPEQFGSLYTSLDEATGTLTLRGGTGTSADAFSVLATPGGYQVSVDVGTDVAGTGPTDAFVSTWSDAQVSSIVIQAGGGADNVEIRTLGSNEPVSIDCGSGDDEVRLAIGDFDTNLLSDVSITGASGRDQLRVNDIANNPENNVYTITSTGFSKPGRAVTFTGVDYCFLDGSQHSDTYNIDSFDGDLTINGHGGTLDTFNVAQPGGDLDDLPGLVRLIGDAGGDTLNLYDHNDTGADNYLFDLYTIDDPRNFTKPGASAGAFTGMYYAGIETILLEGNSAGNTITARDVNAVSLTVDGNGGGDRLVIDDSADTGDDVHTFDRTLFDSTYRTSDDSTVITYRAVEDVTLEASDASNTVNVNGLAADLLINGHLGTDTAVIGGGDINSNVLGSVHFEAFLGGRVVFLDSTNASVSNVYTLDGDEFTAGGPTHTFANVTAVTLECSDNGDTVNVEDTFGYELVVRCNGGTDLINFGGGSLATMDNATVWGGEGGDELRLEDSTTFAPTNYFVDQTGGLPFVELFNGNNVVFYDSITVLRINAGPFADTITSGAMPTSTSLRIAANGGDDTINVRGHPSINSALFEPVVIDGGAGADTVELNTDGQGGARAEFSRSQDLRRLAIGESGHLRLDEGGLVIDVLDSVTMPADGFELDLADGFFVRRGNGSLPYYTSRIAVGRNGGAWDGLGINSSTAEASPARDGLGIARVGDLFNGSGGAISGINLEPNDILIRYALSGDANLDGSVNFRDFVRLARNFNDRDTVWSQGDFNYDGQTNYVDFLLLRANYSLRNLAPRSRGDAAVL